MARKEDAYKLASKRLIEDILHEHEERTLQRKSVVVDPTSARGRAKRLLENAYFSWAASILVMLNAIYLGVETDINRCESDFGDPAWPVIEAIFVVAFMLELLVRAYAERGTFFSSPWALLDAGLVLLSALDVLILQHFVRRARQLLRILLITRVVRYVKDLWFLVEGILAALRTLGWAWLLVVFLSYISAILLTRVLGQEQVAEDPELGELFGSLLRSMYTLFTVLTTEGWADVARRCMERGSFWGVFFVAFISTTTFALLNVVAAVVVQNTLEHASQRAEDTETTQHYKEQAALLKIVEVFKAADADNSGEVTRDEFVASLESPAVVHLLHDVGVDVRQAEGLFDILDYNDSGSLDANEFVEGVMMARGEAKAKEVLAVQCDMWKSERKLTGGLDQMGRKLDSVFKSLLKEIETMKQDFEDVQTSASVVFRAAQAVGPPTATTAEPSSPKALSPEAPLEQAIPLLTPGAPGE